MHIRLTLCLLLSIGLLGLLGPTPAQAEAMAPTAAAFPFFDDFETGGLSANWSTGSSGTGLAEVNADNPRSGTYNAFVGQKQIGFIDHAWLDLTIDLAGQTDVFLDFWWRAVGDGKDGSNGIYISDDGINWKNLMILNFEPQTYGHPVINLAKEAAALGVALNGHFRIRFLYYRFIGIGGLRIDDLRLTTRDQIVASFPLEESFETRTFVQGFYPQSSDAGLTEINDDGPHTGEYNAFIGQRTTKGSDNSWFDLIIDLANQPTVFMDFWWHTVGDGRDSGNALYISNDDVNWKKVYSLNTSKQTYSHVVIDLAAAAANNGITLNNRFRIRFRYARYVGIGGLRIDDLRLGTDDPSQIGRSFLYLPLVKR